MDSVRNRLREFCVASSTIAILLGLETSFEHRLEAKEPYVSAYGNGGSAAGAYGSQRDYIPAGQAGYQAFPPFQQPGYAGYPPGTGPFGPTGGYPGRPVSFQPGTPVPADALPGYGGGAPVVEGQAAAPEQGSDPTFGGESYVDDGDMTGASAPGAFPGLLGNRYGVRTPVWSMGVDFITYVEGNAPSGPAIISDANTQTTIYGPSNLTLDQGMGPKLTLGYSPFAGRTYEASYFGIYDWEQNSNVDGPGNLQLAGPLAFAAFVDFFSADQMRVTYQKNIHNAELNLLQVGYRSWSTWVFGFRFLDWHEQLKIASTDNTTATTSDYSVKTGNNMYGGQVGWNGDIDLGIGVTTVKMRGAFFGNQANQQTSLNDFGNTFNVLNTNNSSSGATSLAELGFSHTLSPNEHIEVRIGYNFMWIHGLARAPGNVDLSFGPNTGTIVQMHDDVFLHGASVGSTFRW
jgi:hypothetical protein